MQQLDPHTLFSIFENGDEEIYEEHGLQDTLNNPYVLIGMVVRGIENYQLLDLMYMRQYPKEYKNVKDAIKYKYYNKLYSYLTRIDSTKFEDIYKVGDSYEGVNTERGLSTLLSYYENIEQYEKCIVIKRYYDLVTSSIVKSYFNG